jgi:hypothetical protein
VLSADGDASIQVARSTISFPGFSGALWTPAMLGDRRFTLEGSIVDSPGRDFLRMRQATNEAVVRDVLVRDEILFFSSGYAPASVTRAHATSNFGFADAENNNYRLQRGSPAIDRYRPVNLDDDNLPDLDLLPRGQDDSAVPNAPGEDYDLGAYEQSDGVFGNGFE